MSFSLERAVTMLPHPSLEGGRKEYASFFPQESWLGFWWSVCEGEPNCARLTGKGEIRWWPPPDQPSLSASYGQIWAMPEKERWARAFGSSQEGSCQRANGEQLRGSITISTTWDLSCHSPDVGMHLFLSRQFPLPTKGSMVPFPPQSHCSAPSKSFCKREMGREGGDCHAGRGLI